MFAADWTDTMSMNSSPSSLRATLTHWCKGELIVEVAATSTLNDASAAIALWREHSRSRKGNFKLGPKPLFPERYNVEADQSRIRDVILITCDSLQGHPQPRAGGARVAAEGVDRRVRAAALQAAPRPVAAIPWKFRGHNTYLGSSRLDPVIRAETTRRGSALQSRGTHQGNRRGRCPSSLAPGRHPAVGRPVGVGEAGA